MDYMFPSRNNEEPPLFLQFPSPFLDDMDTTTTILPNLHQQYPLSTDGCRTTTLNNAAATEPLPLPPCKGKCARKRRSVGKKDRHSKIHTAQGLRDRRMRLSVHTARKFFDLNDLLGFEKASQTIEWLFSKSKKAIEQVTQSHDHAATNKAENLEVQITDRSSRKSSESYPLPLVRERMMMEHLEKPKQLFEADPNVDFDQPQFGFSENPDNHNMEESSCYPLEYSNTHHFLKQLHLDNTMSKTDTYMGNISSTNCSLFDYSKNIAEPPAGWLNSRNTFLGFLGGWDSWSSRMEIVPNIAPLTGNGEKENPSSGIISSNFVNFHSQNQGQ